MLPVLVCLVQIGGTWEPKWKFLHHATLIVTARGVQSTKDRDVPVVKAQAFLEPCGQSNNQSFFSVGGQLFIFPFAKIGLTYLLEHTVVGENSGFGLTNVIGLAFTP